MAKVEGKYISGIYINEFLTKPTEHKKPHLFVINLNENIGIDPHGLFIIYPHIIDQENISFYKEYPNNRLSLTYFGEKHQHPVASPPYVGSYRLEKKDITGKSFFVVSDDPEAVLRLPSLNVLGQDYLSPDFVQSKIVVPKDLSVIIGNGGQSKRYSFQNSFSL
jgi:hypothetical protein